MNRDHRRESATQSTTSTAESALNERALFMTMITGLAVLALVLFAPAAHAWDGYFDIHFNYTGSSCDDGRYSGQIDYVDAGEPWYDIDMDDLGWYGNWRYEHSVGAEVWFPDVNDDWRPYTQGHWVHTSVGLTWVAYEPWGELTHHYGRWVHTGWRGWAWVPGHEYAPAWVNWAVSDGYVGWAPIAPDRYRYPRTVRYGGFQPVSWYPGTICGYPSSGIDFSLWVFVGNNHFYNTGIWANALPRWRCGSLFRTSHVYTVGHSIDFRYVRRICPTPITTVIVENNYINVGGERVVHYRPHGQARKVTLGRRAVRETTGHDLTASRAGKTYRTTPRTRNVVERKADLGRRSTTERKVDKRTSTERNRTVKERTVSERRKVIKKTSKPSTKSEKRSVQKRKSGGSGRSEVGKGSAKDRKNGKTGSRSANRSERSSSRKSRR